MGIRVTDKPDDIDDVAVVATIERLSKIAHTAGKDTGLGMVYEDEHIHIFCNREILVQLKQPDEVGNDVTEVFNVFRTSTDDSGTQTFQFVALRRGAWQDYIRTLCELVEQKSDEDDRRAYAGMDYLTEFVTNDRTAGIVPVIVKQTPTEHEQVESQLTISYRQILDMHRMLRRVAEANGIKA